MTLESTAPVPHAQCGAALAIDLLGDRWSLLILRQVLYRVGRFDDIRRATGCPRAVLSQRLTRLQDAGLVAKFKYQDKGQRSRMAYRPTAAGWDFAKVIFALMAWGDVHIKGGKPALAITDAKTGAPLQMDWVELPTHARKIKLDKLWTDPENRYAPGA